MGAQDGDGRAARQPGPAPVSASDAVAPVPAVFPSVADILVPVPDVLTPVSDVFEAVG